MIDHTMRVEARERAEHRRAERPATTWRARITMLVLATVFAVAGLEVCLNTLPWRFMPATVRTIETFYTRRAEWRLLTEGDRYLGFKLRPDVEVRFPFEGGAIPIRTTSYGVGPIGFRDIGTRPPFGAIAVGDSFTFCDEVVVDDCWVRRLSDASGMSIATLGVSGYSTLAEARVLKQYGRAFGARLVLVGIFTNDLADNVNFDRWTRSGSDDLAVWLEQARTHLPARWLEDRSMLYRLLATASATHERAIHRYRHGDIDVVLRFDDWWLRTVSAPDRHPGWPLMRDALLDMQRTVADMHAELVVLIFPTKEEAYWDVAREYSPAIRNLDVERLPRLVMGFLADHGIAACDLTGELRKHAALGRQLYHRVSGHFNDEGNHLAATAAAACLDSRHLLTVRQHSTVHPEAGQVARISAAEPRLPRPNPPSPGTPSSRPRP